METVWCCGNQSLLVERIRASIRMIRNVTGLDSTFVPKTQLLDSCHNYSLLGKLAQRLWGVIVDAMELFGLVLPVNG